MNIRWKVITVMMILLVLICSIFLRMLYSRDQETLRLTVEGKASAATLMAGSLVSQFSRQYQRRVQSFINDEISASRKQIVEAFARRDGDKLLQLSRPFFKTLQQENAYFSSLGFVLPDNQVFLRVHEPDRRRGNVVRERPDIAAVNREHIQKSGFTAGMRGPQYRVVQPVYFEQKYIGAVQMGVDSRLIIDSLQQKLYLPAAFAIPNDRIPMIQGGNRAGFAGRTHTIFSTNDDFFRVMVEGADWDAREQRLKMSGNSYELRRIMPLLDFEGNVFGHLFVAVNVTEALNQLRHAMLSALLLSFLLMLIAGLVLYFSFGYLLEKIFVLNKSLEQSNRELELRVEERTRDLLQETEERKVAQKRLQRAEKMEAIGLMASGVAHDLNNILSGMVGYPELLLMRIPEDSPLRRSLEAIKQSGLRAAAVVADLLTVARDVAKVRTTTSLNHLVLEYLRSPEGLKLKDLYPDIRITTDLDPELKIVACSPTHVSKCVMNLVMNALEALPGTGNVRVRTFLKTLPDRDFSELLLDEGDYAVLSVHDDGPGISEEDLEHIFEPFYTKKKMGKSGTGIGLTVVWNCMQEHHGTVAVRSAATGTAFYLFFPARKTADGLALAPDPPATFVRGAGQVVLVVDDEEQQRDIARQMLEGLGYRVVTVAGGEQAVAHLKEHQVDLLLLDMMMAPGIDGCETLTRIARQGGLPKTIIVSGYFVSEQQEQARRLGAVDYLKKPYTFDQLGRMVARVLQTS